MPFHFSAYTSTLTKVALGSLLSVSVYAQQCPDTFAATNTPSKPMPAQTEFENVFNEFLANDTPYHMAYDQLVTPNTPATMVAKFDYGSLLHRDLEGETVQAYIYGTNMTNWELLGSFTTDTDGKIEVPLGQRGLGHYQVHFVVTGDLSTTSGYLSVVEANTPTVLFDIDGTLTLNDFEAVGDYLGISSASAYYYAPETVQAYFDKGYCITYLTARPYWLTKDTREWLEEKNIPAFHLHTNPDAELTVKDTAAYKADYIQTLMDNGYNIVRAYGNADTDIEAYAAAGIPKSETYIIGSNAGLDNTQAILDDYSLHYSEIVMNTVAARDYTANNPISTPDQEVGKVSFAYGQRKRSQTFEFYNTSENNPDNVTWRWELIDGDTSTVFSNEFHSRYSFKETGQYSVRLVMITESGAEYSHQLSFDVHSRWKSDGSNTGSFHWLLISLLLPLGFLRKQ